MLRFVTGRPLWVNILASIVLVFVLLVSFMLSLNWCTRHGKIIQIPTVTGMSYTDAIAFLEEKGFEVEMQDSVYYDTVPALQVVRQFPEADAVVKRNRTVYLTVNRSVPPTIEMPKLVGLTFRTADAMIRQYGLKRGDTIYRMDFAKNSVLEQLYNDEPIKPGTKIQMGSTINLVLGTGVGAFEFTVPDLFGYTFEEAKTFLQANGLSVGVSLSDPDVVDIANAFVYRQDPTRMTEDGRFNRIRGGQTVDLWLSVAKPVRIVDSTKALMPPSNDY